jgi:Phasin protein
MLLSVFAAKVGTSHTASAMESLRGGGIGVSGSRLYPAGRSDAYINREHDMSKSFASISASAANRNTEQNLNPSMMFLDPWVHATTVSAKMASACCDEAVRFAGLRLSRNRETAEQFAKCSNWRDIMDLQMGWASDFMQDCLNESHQLLEIAQKTSIAPTNGHEAESEHKSKRAA